MNGDASTTGSRARTPVLGYLWIALLGYVVLGGALAQVFGLAGLVGPYCSAPAVCEPCALSYGMAGVIGMNSCPNQPLALLSLIGMEAPHLLVIFLAMMAYPVEEALRRLSPFLPVIVLALPLVIVLARTVHVNFFNRRRVSRGLHRALLVGLVLLVVNMTMMWGGAWPWGSAA